MDRVFADQASGRNTDSPNLTELLRLARNLGIPALGISGFGEQLELPNGVGERGELLITQFDGGATYVVFKVGDA